MRNRLGEFEGCCWPGCDGERYIHPDSPPLCLNHIIKVTAWGSRVARDIGSADIESCFLERRVAFPRIEAPSTSVVYYVRLGPHIKIGTTRNLQARMAGLYVDHDPEALLVTEPGDRKLESRRHAEFWDDRVYANRELFRPSSRLLAHIESLKVAAA